MIATQRQNGMAEGWGAHLHVTRCKFFNLQRHKNSKGMNIR
jgi:hypothetical protein